MRAVITTAAGGPDVLRIVDRPLPIPLPGEIRVRVRASALNRADLLQRRGRYPAPAGYPQDVPGLEYAGEVDEIGQGVDRWRVGDRVMGIIGAGAHAEYVRVREEEAIPIPPALSWEEAAAVPEVFITAFDALFRQAGLKSEETVLIHAVGSGVGTAALQLVRTAGAIGIGSSRTPAKLDAASALGLPHTVDGAGDWIGDVEIITEGRGVDVVLDLVGGAYVADDVRVLAERGRVVVVGLMAGARAEIDLALLMRKRARLIGTVLRSRSPEEKAALAAEFTASVNPLLADGSVRPVIDRVLPFDDVVEAHHRLERNESFGKIVLVW